MSQIQQQSDGTYTKSYSATELAIIRELHAEQQLRVRGDQSLKEELLGLETDVKDLKEQSVDLSSLVERTNVNALDIQSNREKIETLEKTSMIEVYSKTEIDQYLPLWKIEEISRIISSVDDLTNSIFDETNIKDIRSGYMHYPNANINDINITELESGDLIYSETNEIRPNTVRRYTIWAYSKSNRTVDFRIRFGDACVVLAYRMVGNEMHEQRTVFENPSYDTERLVTVDLAIGWTKIQFLISNRTQGAGLYVNSDIATKADKLASFDVISGKFTGDQIELGTLTDQHFNENMDIRIKRLHATVGYDPNTQSIIPGLVAGDADTGGAVQVGDGTISKQKDEPFIFNSDIRIMGKLLDQDGTVIDESTLNLGLSTEERQKIDSVSFNAEENQFAFSYLEVAGVPYPIDELGNVKDPSHSDFDPLWNLISADAKTDTLKLKGEYGIEFDIEKDSEGEATLVIRSQPTMYKEELFVATLNQQQFVLTSGEYRPNTGSVSVFVGGQRIGSDKFNENEDGKTISLIMPQPAGTEVLVTWQEGGPSYASETIVTVADIPAATRSTTGLMTKEHVNYLYDHKHTIDSIEGMPDQEDLDQMQQDIYDLQNQLGSGTGDGSSLVERIAELEEAVGITDGGGPSLSDQVSQLEQENANQANTIRDLEQRLEALENQILTALTYT